MIDPTTCPNRRPPAASADWPAPPGYQHPETLWETLATPQELAARRAPAEPGPVLCALGLVAIAAMLWAIGDQMREPLR